MGRYAIFIVLALTFSLLTYSHALKNALFQSNTRTVQSYSHSQAQNIAQSAAMMAITSLRTDNNSVFLPETDSLYAYPSFNGFQDWEDMYGSYQLTLSNQGDSLLILQSTGRFEEALYRAQIGMVIGPSIWDPEFDQAVHAENKISLSSNVTVEGDATINSSESGAVTLEGSHNKMNIEGNLYIGPNGVIDNVISGNSNAVEGDIYNLPKELDYPLPIFPEFPPINLTTSSIYTTQTLQPSDYDGYYIPEIVLNGNSTLTINLGDEDRSLHVGNFDIQSGDVIINGEGTLTLYIDNEIDMGGNSTVNESGDVGKLMTYYRGNHEVDLADDEIELGGNTLFNGSLFAKYANIHLRGTAGIQGNVITGGSSITLRGNASAISRTVYAPFATVETVGNVVIRGSLIADRFYGSGTSSLIYDSELDSPLPDLEQEGGGYDIAFWN
jgi:hypothetical protein